MLYNYLVSQLLSQSFNCMLIYLTNQLANPLIDQGNLVTAGLLDSLVLSGPVPIKPLINSLTHLVSLLRNTPGMLVTL